MLNQDAVYWAPVKDAAGRVVPDVNGRTSYLPPRPIKVFWIDNVQTIKDAAGNERVSRSTVFVGEDLDADGVLFEGPLASVPQSGRDKPFLLVRSYKILGKGRIRTIKGDQQVRTVFL